MVMNGYELWVCMPLATYNVGFVRSKWIVLSPTSRAFLQLVDVIVDYSLTGPCLAY